MAVTRRKRFIRLVDGTNIRIATGADGVIVVTLHGPHERFIVGTMRQHDGAEHHLAIHLEPVAYTGEG